MEAKTEKGKQLQRLSDEVMGLFYTLDEQGLFAGTDINENNWMEWCAESFHRATEFFTIILNAGNLSETILDMLKEDDLDSKYIKEVFDPKM